MRQSIRTKLVKMGNSRGIIIPKRFIECIGLAGDIDMVITTDHLELRPSKRPRQGWAAAFQKMAERKDDQMPDQPVPTEWDAEEWHW